MQEPATLEQQSAELDFGPLYARLSRDMKEAAATLGPREARYTVDLYYQMQAIRTRTGNQARQLGEPTRVHEWIKDQEHALENSIKGLLGAYVKKHVIGDWLLNVYGIGPVIAAGLISHVNIRECDTSGKLWKYAGMAPPREYNWLSREEAKTECKRLELPKNPTTEQLLEVAKLIKRRPENFLKTVATIDPKHDKEAPITLSLVERSMCVRPWNPKLKVLCWKAGTSFKMYHGKVECYYGHVYAKRKELEIARNEQGLFAEEAKLTLSEKNFTDPETKAIYEAGKLPAGRLDLRAMRYATKLFLSHFHDEWWRRETGTEPVKPYPITNMGHTHFIPDPQSKSGTEAPSE
jgi:hypothetical protein